MQTASVLVIDSARTTAPAAARTVVHVVRIEPCNDHLLAAVCQPLCHVDQRRPQKIGFVDATTCVRGSVRSRIWLASPTTSEFIRVSAWLTISLASSAHRWRLEHLYRRAQSRPSQSPDQFSLLPENMARK